MINTKMFCLQVASTWLGIPQLPFIHQVFHFLIIGSSASDSQFFGFLKLLDMTYGFTPCQI